MMILRCLVAILLALPLSLWPADMVQIRALIDARRVPEAKPLIEAALVEDPNNAEAQLLLGRCLWKMGKVEEAKPVLEKASSQHPNDAPLMAELGLVYMNIARKENSISMVRKGRKVLDRALELDPENQVAHEILYAFYANAPWIVGGSMDKAMQHALAVKPKNPQRALVMLVGLKNKAREFQSSFALCTEVLATNPEDYAALYEFGFTCATSGQRLTEGLAALEKCLTLPVPGPSVGPANVHYYLGMILLKQGDRRLAAQQFDEGLRIEPSNPQLQEAHNKLAGTP